MSGTPPNNSGASGGSGAAASRSAAPPAMSTPTGTPDFLPSSSPGKNSSGVAVGTGVFGTTQGVPLADDPEFRHQSPPDPTPKQASAALDAAKKAGDGAGCVFDGSGNCPTGTPMTRPQRSGPPNAFIAQLAKNERAMADPELKKNYDWFLKLEGMVAEKRLQLAAIKKEIERGQGDAAVLKAKEKTIQNDIGLLNEDQKKAEQEIKKQAKKLKFVLEPDVPEDASASKAEKKD
jgi:hypothetical protein